MRFLRHLAAVSLAVAIVIALGVSWSHGNGPSRPAQRMAAPHRADGFSLGNPQDLERTILIEAVLGGIVITVSRARHRRRQTRRRTLTLS